MGCAEYGEYVDATFGLLVVEATLMILYKRVVLTWVYQCSEPCWGRAATGKGLYSCIIAYCAMWLKLYMIAYNAMVHFTSMIST